MTAKCLVFNCFFEKRKATRHDEPRHGGHFFEKKSRTHVTTSHVTVGIFLKRKAAPTSRRATLRWAFF
jgi:hypothetical protein